MTDASSPDRAAPSASSGSSSDSGARSEALATLLALLDLEQIEKNLFRGHNSSDSRARLFGGQVLAQGLVAALRTVQDGRLAHSLHGYFLRPGDPKIPIVFDIDRIRDGKSFTTRRVVAVQRGEAILNMDVSFQVQEEGFEHQIEMPNLSATDLANAAVADADFVPEGEPYEDELRRGAGRMGFEPPPGDLLFDPPVEIRTIGGLRMFEVTPRPPYTRCWVRARGRLPDDPALHQCVLAYASDMTLLSNAVYPHPVGATTRGFQSATIDHAMWFHRPFRADEWLLYVQESPVSARSRGFCRGTFFTRSGVLVASCAQEGLIRYRPPDAASERGK